jgi:hypothetical protein
MAYTVTMTFTRPDEGTAMPTMETINSSAKASSATLMADNGITKTFEVDGLVTKVIYTAEDKSTLESGKALIDDITGETTARSTYKTQCEAANITCTVVDSDGVSIANF